MKKIYLLVPVISMIALSCFAYTEHNIQGANFVAEKWIINDHSDNVLNYNLDFNITRREMLKVTMNLSGKTVVDTCNNSFADMGASDWGCKYAEAALTEGFIAANANYRPNDNVTQIEALKMIMLAKGIQRDQADDWRAGYVSKAQSEDIVDTGYFNYDMNATRGWIFSGAARTYSDFTYETPEANLDPDVEELINSLLDL